MRPAKPGSDTGQGACPRDDPLMRRIQRRVRQLACHHGDDERVALPPMRKLGYAPSLAAGSIAAGGTLGILIPPSVIMVLYGIMTNTDISKLFIAGILPGLLGVLLYVLTIAILTRLRPAIGPPSAVASWTLRWRSVATVWEVVLLFVLVIGGIYAGAFTPTEAAGVGAGGALLAAILRRRITAQAIGEALYETARMTAGIFLILVGALVFRISST